MTETNTKVGGIDTAKDKLDIALHGQAGTWRVDNAMAGWRRLAGQLKAAGVGRVGIEASGGYERGVSTHLRGEGIAVEVLQPAQVRAFGQLMRRRAKNDALDAALIAACTAGLAPKGSAPDERLERLAGELTFLEQTEDDIRRLKVRLEHLDAARPRRLVEADIARLKLRRAASMLVIARQLRQHADLARRLDLVLGIPGIGERTALALVVRMPELGRISRQQAAALAGLAPYDRDSGASTGQRHIAGGRARLRRSLFAAALPAAFQWNPAVMALYARLKARGKAHNAAMIACARKLLIFANAVVQRGTPWVDRPLAQ
jgi:transposase